MKKARITATTFNRLLFGLMLPFLMPFNLLSQSVNTYWTQGVGGPYFDQGKSITVAPSGNVYMIGIFGGTVDFDKGPGTYNLIGPANSMFQNAFISKYDSSGNLIWAKSFSGWYILGNDLAIDANENIYTVGYFPNTIDFDPGPGQYIITGNQSGYLCKLDSGGHFVWVIEMRSQIAGTTNAQSVCIAPDGTGNIYVGGTFKGTSDFDPDTVNTYLLNAAGSYGGFVAEYDSSGHLIWAGKIDGNGDDRLTDIAADTAGYLYATGKFDKTCDFNPGTGVYAITSSPSNSPSNIFICKLSTIGNFIWAKKIDGISGGSSIALDNFSNVYTTGFYIGPADFDPGAGTFILQSLGSNAFISKLDSAGDFVFAKSLGDSAAQEGNAIFVDASQRIYTTGFFIGTTDFDPGPGLFPLTSNGLRDIFISRLDDAGNFECAAAIGGSGNDFSAGITVNSSGVIHLAGSYESSPLMIGTDTLTNAGSEDILAAKLDCQLFVGTEPLPPHHEINVYPNPTHGSFFVDFNRFIQQGSISIYNFLGEEILHTPIVSTSTVHLHLTHLASGMYIIKTFDDVNFNFTTLIIR